MLSFACSAASPIWIVLPGLSKECGIRKSYTLDRTPESSPHLQRLKSPRITSKSIAAVRTGSFPILPTPGCDPQILKRGNTCGQQKWVCLEPLPKARSSPHVLWRRTGSASRRQAACPRGTLPAQRSLHAIPANALPTGKPEGLPSHLRQERTGHQTLARELRKELATYRRT